MKISSISLKVLAGALIAVSATGVALAGNYKGEGYYKGDVPCPVRGLKDGIYLGAQVGYDSYRIRENQALPGPVNGNPAIDLTGWVGGLFLGYGQYVTNQFYLGAEILGNYSGANTSYSFGSYNSKVTVKGSAGIDFIPGLKLNDSSLGYLRLGYKWARFQSQESLTGGSAASKSSTQGGFNYGLGIETLVYENWSIRTEYTHTNYNSFTSGLGTKFSPSDNQVMLGVLYHFV